MGNLKKAILNERDDCIWNLESIDKTSEFIEKQMMQVASESVRVALLDDDHYAGLGIHPKLGSGIFLSVFVDKYVLYFDAETLFDAECSERSEVEEVSKWFRMSHERMEKELVEEKPCPHCDKPMPKIHDKTCCDECFAVRFAKNKRTAKATGAE